MQGDRPDRSDDVGSQFDQLLGAFGTHADVERRKKAERLAAMHPNDPRRRPAVRTNQFNVRVSDQCVEAARALIERFAARDSRKWSQADLIEHAIAELAKAHKIGR